MNTHKHLPPRWDAQDAWYFVTVVALKRHPYFLSESACLILLEACRSVRGKHPYRMGALVILPDHWHALIKPLENEVIESIVGSIKQRAFHASRRIAVFAAPRPNETTSAPHGTTPHPNDGASTPHAVIPHPHGSAAFHGGERTRRNPLHVPHPRYLPGVRDL